MIVLVHIQFGHSGTEFCFDLILVALKPVKIFEEQNPIYTDKSGVDRVD